MFQNTFILLLLILERTTFFNMPLINGDILNINRDELNYSKVGMSVLLNNNSAPDGEYFAQGDIVDKLLV